MRDPYLINLAPMSTLGSLSPKAIEYKARMKTIQASHVPMGNIFIKRVLVHGVVPLIRTVLQSTLISSNKLCGRGPRRSWFTGVASTRPYPSTSWDGQTEDIALSLGGEKFLHY